jgi:integrase
MAATYKRTVGKSGNVTWSTVVDLGTDPATGKRRQKRISGHTRKDVERQAAEAIQRAETGFLDSKRVTVADFFSRWLEATAPTLRPSTLRRYRDLARLHLFDTIGRIPLAKLTPGDVQRLYSDRLTRLSPTSVRHLHNLLHTMLDDAVKWGLIVRNVCDAVDPPRRNRPETQTWNAAEVARVLVTAADDDLEAFWRLALTTGMRRGELLGVKWSDIDLESGSLSVRRSLSRGESSRLVEGEPKTQAGRRRISLSASVVESLRRHRVRQLEYRLQAGVAYTDHGYVFTNETGGYLHPNSVTVRYRKLIERAGVPAIRFHDLRHTSATLMLSEGIHPKIVQERLGHTDIAMTLNLYSHVSPDMQRQAADAIETAILRQITESQVS